jgi:hypothetical protein
MSQPRFQQPDGPSDLQIAKAIRETAEKQGPVHCFLLRIRLELSEYNDADAWDLVAELQQRDLDRIASLPEHSGIRVELASDQALWEVSKPRIWKENRVRVGLECYSYVVGATLTIRDFGADEMDTGNGQVFPYTYQIKPLASMRGRRLSAVWGQEGLPGTHEYRGDVATRLLVHALQTKAGSPLPMSGSCFPTLEVRSVKIGVHEGRNVYGFVVLGISEMLKVRLFAASEELRDAGLDLCTLSEYKERYLLAKDAGNQENDAQEAQTAGRKYMVWNIPRTLTQESLSSCCAEFLGAEFEFCAVTLSAQCHPYGWFITCSDSAETQQLATDFEAVLQSRYGLELAVAQSRTRQQRIRMNAAHRDRLEQDQALNPGPGQLKQIIIPRQAIHDAMMEGAFMDLWIDAMYTRLAPRLVNDLAKAIEDRVQQMVDERVESVLNKRLRDYDLTIIQKVMETIDSAVDFSLEAAIQARQLHMGAADASKDLHIDDLTDPKSLGLGASKRPSKPSPPETTPISTPSIGIRQPAYPAAPGEDVIDSLRKIVEAPSPMAATQLLPTAQNSTQDAPKYWLPRPEDSPHSTQPSTPPASGQWASGGQQPSKRPLEDTLVDNLAAGSFDITMQALQQTHVLEQSKATRQCTSNLQPLTPNPNPGDDDEAMGEQSSSV